MKFLPHRDFDEVTSALNFDTADCHVIGGCDLYTTKAAGSDKKLYKSIEHGLEAQHEALVQFSRSLSPPQASLAAASLNLSRSSPFGSLSEHSSRRTYAYLIATLNASHPDYDFSNSLRPSDFKKVPDLRPVMNNVDTALYNLRPRPSVGTVSLVPGLTPASACPPSAQHMWGPRMWRLIDNQMSLRDCSIYRYEPDEDIFEGEDGAVWSINYFFFSKTQQTPMQTPIRRKRSIIDEDSTGFATPESAGARKRARYWLGDRDDVEVAATTDDEQAESDERGDHGKPLITVEDTDDEVLEPLKNSLVDENDNYVLSDEDVRSATSASKSTVRGISEDIAESMEV